MGYEMPLFDHRKPSDVAQVDIAETGQLQMRPHTGPTCLSPEIRASQTSFPPLPDQIIVADATQTDKVPLLPPIDGGLAAWRVLIATILVQALPVGGLTLPQCFVRFPTS
jgi:hypothetical protein